MKHLKLCYFLLNYQCKTHRHYYHIYEFIEELGKRLELRLVVMEASDTPDFSSPEKIITLTGNSIQKRIRMYLEIVKARSVGYRLFYHHYTTASARFSSLITRIFGGKTYLWHCIDMDALDKMTSISRWKKGLLKMTFHLCDYLVTGMPGVAESYAKRYQLPMDRIQIIPNYINMERFDPEKFDKINIRKKLNIPPDKKVILYLHELEEGRSAHLIPVVHKMLVNRNDVFFLIAGDGRYRKVLESEFEEYITNKSVRFDGSIPNVKAPQYYAAADVYIMTSDFEAFSRVLLEAMAMNIPYVATDGGGNIREYTPEEHQKYILPVQRIGEFPEKIGCLLDDPEEKTVFVNAGKKHIKKFSIQKVLDLFQKMLMETGDN